MPEDSPGPAVSGMRACSWTKREVEVEFVNERRWERNTVHVARHLMQGKIFVFTEPPCQELISREFSFFWPFLSSGDSDILFHIEARWFWKRSIGTLRSRPPAAIDV
jgi:hypothetical protein